MCIGLIFSQYEFCDQTDPFEAGIGFAVGLKKTDDFIGKEALLRRHAHPQKILIGLRWTSNDCVSHGDTVYYDRQRVCFLNTCLSFIYDLCRWES